MKKFLFFVLLSIFTSINAQKRILVGGNVSFNTSTNTIDATNSEIRSDQFSFKPILGYVINKQFLVGTKLGISTSKDTSKDNLTGIATTSKSSSEFSYGVFGRYTLNLNEIFSVFGDLDIYGSTGKTTKPIISGANISYVESKTKGFGITFTPNLQINFNNYLALNFNIGNIGFSHSEIEEVGNKTDQFGFQFGKGVVLGISKKF